MAKPRIWRQEKKLKKEQGNCSKNNQKSSTRSQPLVCPPEPKGVEFTSYNFNFKSQEQKEIFQLLTEEFLTPPQIAKKRNVTKSSVYKTINKLKSYGLLTHISNNNFISRNTKKEEGLTEGGDGTPYSTKKSTKSVPPSEPPIVPPVCPPETKSKKKTYRLHGQCLIIELLEPSQLYTEILKHKSWDTIENNTISLHPNSIVVYFNKDFWGSEVDECVRKSLDYTQNLIVKLENTYKVLLWKGKRCNIREFKGHIAKVGDPYAKEINLRGDKLQVFDEDGTLRLLVDNSYKLNELEAVSPKHYIGDMKKLEEKWLDLIKTDLRLSDVERHLAVLQSVNLRIFETQEQMQQNITNLAIRIDQMSIILEKTINLVKETKEEKGLEKYF